MKFDKSTYHGLLCSGSLREACEYLMSFPEKEIMVERIKRRMEDERPIVRSKNTWIHNIDTIFQWYYKAVFWRGISREEGAQYLYQNLMPIVGEDRLRKLFEDFFKDEAEDKFQDIFLRVSGVEELLIPLAEKEGYHYLGGQTQGYFGPYIWKEMQTESYLVEIPAGLQKFELQMMDGFVSRSWLDYISMGKIGSGGWESNGTLFCVKKCYEKELSKPSFLVSFLKHEAQHAYDNEHFKGMSATMLEYRAKLTELIYYPSISCFRKFLAEANGKDKDNSHSYAAYLIVHNLSKLVFSQDYVSDYSKWKRQLKKVKQYSKECYDNFLENLI